MSLIDLVRSELRDGLASHGGGIEDVALALDLPRWKLQRELNREGCTFSDLLEDMRKKLALIYLAQPRLPLTDIAFMLGYSELSAFSRSFNRWQGVSPSRWRAKNTQGSPGFLESDGTAQSL